MDDLGHKRIAKIAIPIVLANVTVPILGAVDTGVVGQLGQAAPIGAVGLGAISLTAIYWIFGFLRMGTVGLASQAIGAGDKAELSALLSRVIFLGFSAGLFLIVTQSFLINGAFWLSPGSTEVESLAENYIRIRVLSAPAAIALFGITGWLVARERTGAVLALQLWINGLNIVLDLLFVLQLNWGVDGVAWATFIAEWSGFMLGIFLCRDVLKMPGWHNAARIFDRVTLRRMAAVNVDILIRSALLQAVFVSFLFIGAGFGDVTLAANQILLQFVFVTSYAMDGATAAVEVLVGRAVGAKNRVALRRSVILTGQWAAIIVVVCGVSFGLFGSAIADIMTTSEAVRAAFRTYLPYIILAPLVGWVAWLMDGIFIGATRTKDMRNMMVLSSLVYLAAILILVPQYQNHGLWVALLISFIARGITLSLRYPALERSAED